MRSFIYDVLSILLPFHGSSALNPLDILDVKWMEPRNSIPDLLLLSYLQGLSRTAMNAGPIRNTATRRHSMFQNTVFFSRFQLIKNPDVSIATKSLPLYSKIKITSNKAFKSKENNIKSNNKKENNIKALKKNNIIYVQSKKKRKENVYPPLKIFNQMS